MSQSINRKKGSGVAKIIVTVFSGLLLAMGLLACSSDSEDPAQSFDDAVRLSDAVNSSALDAGPEISSDDTELYFHSDRTGGEGALDIWVANRNAPGALWNAAVNLGTNINTVYDDRAPALSSDGLTLIFASTRPGGEGDSDLYVSTRSAVGQPWGMPANLGTTINTPYLESGPTLSADSLTLIFQSDRPGSTGELDLYIATRPSVNDPWDVPVNMGATVNSVSHDLAPSISSDGLALYFHSTRTGGPGTFNIWVTTRMSTMDNLSTPTLVAAPVSTSADELGPGISSDGRTLYFTSDRPGSVSRDIWQVSW